MTAGKGEKKLEEVVNAVSVDTTPRWGRSAASQIRAFGEEVSPGDFIWSRDVEGKYLLGKFAADGGWEFQTGARNHRLDLHQLRPVSWARRRLEPDEAPGSVVRSFSGYTRAFQRIHQGGIAEATRDFYWPLMNYREPAAMAPDPFEAIEGMISPSELEDLVIVWLQAEHGYLFIPSSRTRSTPVFECALVSRRDFHRAYPQVKSGGAPLDLAKLSKALGGNEVGYAFSATGNYRGTPSRRVRLIEKVDLVKFAQSKKGKAILPASIRRWF